MKEIPLTKGHVTLVDDDDYQQVMDAGSWCSDGGKYACKTISAKLAGGKQKTLRLHTFLTGWPYVDHVNGDGLDNRRVNLRPSSNQTNSRNKGLQSNNGSGFKGVRLYRRTGRWVANIQLDGRSYHLGYFDSAEEAARAYDAAAIQKHETFARLNFPEGIAS